MVIRRDKIQDKLAKKLRLLHETKYCESLIADAEARNKNVTQTPSNFSDVGFDVESDSDDDVDPYVDIGPTMLHLKKEHDDLRNCLSATQELCDVQIIESEVIVLTEEPKLKNERPVREPGVWKEVTAECSVDLIRVIMSFYMHRSERKFAPTSFRGLHVKLVKSKYEIELNKSILSDLTRPSDAIEVIRSYSAASRSRRETMARLLDKYPNDIAMDTKPDGGFTIECPLMKISWTLQNKWSPVAPFHHRINIDVEYMDEQYVMPISQAHRQLSEPDVSTDERSALLARIISTCLRARSPTRELHETMCSDADDPDHMERLKIRLNNEPEAPGMHGETKDSTIMAPPKMLPKKSKPKTKGNMVDSGYVGRTTKRSIQDGGTSGAKRGKGDEVENIQEIAKLVENVDKNRDDAKNKSEEKITQDKTTKGDKQNVKTTEKPVAKVVTEKNKQTQNVATEKNLAKTVGEKNKAPASVTSGKVVNEKQTKENATQNKKIANSAGRLDMGKKVPTNKNANEITAKTQKNAASKNINKDTKNKVIQQGKVIKKVLNKSGNRVVNKVTKSALTTSTPNSPAIGKIDNNGKSAKITDSVEKTKNLFNTTLSSVKNAPINPTKTVAKSVASVQQKNPTAVKKISNNFMPPKNMTGQNKLKSNIVKPKHTAVGKNVPFKTFNPQSANNKVSAGKIFNTGNIEKENKAQNKVMSKLPQKQKVPEVVMKKNPLRISPRKGLSQPGASGCTKSGTLKPVSTTHIPRLVPKPKPRVT